MYVFNVYVFKYDKHSGQFENVTLIIIMDCDENKYNYDLYALFVLFLSLIEITLSLIAGIIRTLSQLSAIDKRGHHYMKSPASTHAFAP